MKTALYLSLMAVLALTAARADGMRSIADKMNRNLVQEIRDAQPPPEMEMTVRLVDAKTGAYIAGAEVRVVSAESSAKVHTDQKGAARAGLAKKQTDYLTVTASHPLYVPTRARWYKKDESFPVPPDFELTLEPGRTIGGQVVNDKGEPVSDAVVSLRLAERTRHKSQSPVIDAHLWQQKVTTDDAGRWSYAQAPSNLEELTIKVTHPLYVEAVVDISEVERAKLLHGQQDVITLDTGAVVVGRVVGPDGKAVPNADVKLRAPRIGNAKAAVAKSDHEGRFFFPAVSNGTLTLIANANGKGPGLIRYELDDEAPLLEVPLEKPQRVFGRVVDPSGEPVPGAMISMELWRGTVDIEPVAVTDKDGNFSWNEAPTDQVMFRVSKNGFISNRIPLLTGEEQEIILSAKRIVRGKVTDALTGKPIHKFEVVLGMVDQYDGVVWFQTNPLVFGYGQYRVNLDVPTDNLVIGIRAEGYADAQSKPIATPATIEKVNFALQPE